MPKLILSMDGVVLKEMTLAKERTTLGRRPRSDVVLDDRAVSGEHAVFHMVGDEVFIEDLHSTNGTRVNGQRVRNRALVHQDLVQVSKYKILFLTQEAGADEAAMLRVLTGSGARQDLVLRKVVTAVGKPGMAMAAVTRRGHGYVVSPVDGGAKLNGKPLGTESAPLQDGDTLELGGTRMQFVHARARPTSAIRGGGFRDHAV